MRLPRGLAALLAAGLVLLAAPAAPAQPARLSAALIDEAVLVTSSFSGARITVFGSFRAPEDGRTDVLVLVRGPDRPAWIGQRQRTAGLWLGEDRIRLEAAPTYFGVATARPLGQIAPEDTLGLYGLTALSQIELAPGEPDTPRAQGLVRAYVAERERQGLFVANATGVRLLPGGLFRADLEMPDTTPPGLYTAKVMLFRNGRPLESTLSSFVVSKVGAERAMFEFARDFPALHGLAGVLLALLSGFVAARVFRRISFR